MSIIWYYDTRLIIWAPSYLPRIPSSKERGRLFSRRTSSSSSFSSPLTLADRPPSPWSVDASSLPSVRRRARAADRDRDASKINRFADPIWKTESNGLYERRQIARLGSEGFSNAIPVPHKGGSPSEPMSERRDERLAPRCISEVLQRSVKIRVNIKAQIRETASDYMETFKIIKWIRIYAISNFWWKRNNDIFSKWCRFGSFNAKVCMYLHSCNGYSHSHVSIWTRYLVAPIICSYEEE